jgi:hypothetical protein
MKYSKNHTLMTRSGKMTQNTCILKCKVMFLFFCYLLSHRTRVSAPSEFFDQKHSKNLVLHSGSRSCVHFVQPIPSVKPRFFYKNLWKLIKYFHKENGMNCNVIKLLLIVEGSCALTDASDGVLVSFTNRCNCCQNHSKIHIFSLLDAATVTTNCQQNLFNVGFISKVYETLFRYSPPFVGQQTNKTQATIHPPALVSLTALRVTLFFISSYS